MPRATVSPERLQALTEALTQRCIAADAEPALQWVMSLTPDERKALAPVTRTQNPRGKDSREWERQRKVARLVNALCAQKPKDLVDEHWHGAELRQLLAHGPLPWLDAMRTQANRRGWLSLHIDWADEHWLGREGHVSVPLTERLRGELIGTYPFVGGYDWRVNRPIPAPPLAEVPAEFWAQDLWLLFTQPLGPRASVTPDSQQDAWMPAFVQAAGQYFPRETAIARLLASLHIPALKQNQIGWQVQLIGALKPTPAEWAAHASELLLALASPLSTVQGMGLQGWLTLAQAPELPADTLPLAALLQEIGVLWAVKTKAVHKQALGVMEALAQRIAQDPDPARQSELRSGWREAAVLGLIQPDASHQKRLLQLLMQHVPERAELAALLAGSQDLIGQAGRQLLAKAGVDLSTGGATSQSAGMADSVAHGVGAHGLGAQSATAQPLPTDALDGTAFGTHEAEQHHSAPAEPTPVNVQLGRFEDWALDLVSALRADQSTHAAPIDLAHWHRALHGLALHLPTITPEQLKQLGPAWLQANTGAASPLATLFAAQLKRMAATAPALQAALTQLSLAAKDKLSWHNRSAHADAFSKALARPTSGPLLQAMRWRMRQADAAVRALPLLSAPSHSSGFVSVRALLDRVAALAAAGLDVAGIGPASAEVNAADDDSAQPLTSTDLLADLQADLQLALHRLWLPAPGSAAHRDALDAVSASTSEKTGGSTPELPQLLAWLLSGEYALPTAVTAQPPAHPAWWADAALAHGRDVSHPALQVGEHPLASYAALRLQLADLRADDPEALVPELTAAEADANFPSQQAEALMSGWLSRRAGELGLQALAPYLVKVKQPYRTEGGPKLAAEQTSAQQLQQIAGNSWAADGIRRFRLAYRQLRLDRKPPALWVERAIQSLRGLGALLDAAEFLPTLPALWVGASLGDFHEVTVGAISGRAPNWPQDAQLRRILGSLALRPDQAGPWDDARCTVLALGLSDKDAATRGQAVQLLRSATRDGGKADSRSPSQTSSPSSTPALNTAATSEGATSPQASPQTLNSGSKPDASQATASLARVLALLLRNMQISLPRLSDCLRHDALPEPGLAPKVAGLLLALLAQLPSEPLRGHKALLELAGDALGQCGSPGAGDETVGSRAVVQALPAPLRAALDARLQDWAQASATKSAAKSLLQQLAQMSQLR